MIGIWGNNFVKTIMNLAKERNELTVVDDQIGSPTFSYNLAVFLLSLMYTEAYGIYHATNSGYCSWYEFACAIIDNLGIKGISLRPIKTSELRRPASRPPNSVLVSMSIGNSELSCLPPWQDGLLRFIEELKKRGN